jgi:hypothetical protein
MIMKLYHPLKEEERNHQQQQKRKEEKNHQHRHHLTTQEKKEENRHQMKNQQSRQDDSRPKRPCVSLCMCFSHLDKERWHIINYSSSRKHIIAKAIDGFS